ncbi:hypothetical protein IQ07DRAFT_593824 [Pyrenochaeta sp. DS3sAY3a]|nr:hypothetical protein IQ07DRAFT_593824 [Pyrenochaeta sp. DS3sAY3a]
MQEKEGGPQRQATVETGGREDCVASSQARLNGLADLREGVQKPPNRQRPPARPGLPSGCCTSSQRAHHPSRHRRCALPLPAGQDHPSPKPPCPPARTALAPRRRCTPHTGALSPIQTSRDSDMPNSLLLPTGQSLPSIHCPGREHAWAEKYTLR